MDRRRYAVIETRRINAETYHLSIGGRLWSEIEWSTTRKVWCVQDAAGHCLTHVSHIVGRDLDPQAAIALAKKLIVDGRMPSPEEAHARLRAEQEHVQERVRAKTPAKKQISNKQQTNKYKTNKQPNTHQTNKRTKKSEPIGELIVGDITARSELVPVVEDRKLKWTAK